MKKKSVGRVKKTGKVHEAPAMPRSRSVDIEKIVNGYVVSTWRPKGPIKKFAKSEKEAKKIAGEML